MCLRKIRINRLKDPGMRCEKRLCGRGKVKHGGSPRCHWGASCFSHSEVMSGFHSLDSLALCFPETDTECMCVPCGP